MDNNIYFYHGKGAIYLNLDISIKEKERKCLNIYSLIKNLKRFNALCRLVNMCIESV